MSSPPAEMLHTAPSLDRPFRFPLTISERKVLLFVGDSMAILAALVAVLRWRLGEPSVLGILRLHASWLAILFLVWTGCAALFAVYDLGRAGRYGSSVRDGMGAALTACLAYVAIPFVTPALNDSRLTAGAFIGLGPITVASWRLVYGTVLAHPTFRRRVGIVGTNGAGQTVADILDRFGRAEYELVGFITVNGGSGGPPGRPILGEASELPAIAQRWRLSELILAHKASDEGADLVRGLLSCQEMGVQMTSVVGLSERLVGKVPLSRAGGNLQSVLPLDRIRGPSYLLLKRALDILVGVLGCMVVVVVAPFVLLAQRVESPGPLFYRQVRVGRQGRHFVAFKFRTMRPEAEADGPQWAAADDPRIIRTGRLLRRLHLDELPQAFNVLRGHMSFVGPRPERPEFVEQLEQAIPFYRARHAVRPGLTGWAQVNFGYASSVDDSLVKLQFDLYYLKHMSFSLDLFIALQTVGLLLGLRRLSTGSGGVTDEA